MKVLTIKCESETSNQYKIVIKYLFTSTFEDVSFSNGLQFAISSSMRKVISRRYIPTWNMENITYYITVWLYLFCYSIYVYVHIKTIYISYRTKLDKHAPPHKSLKTVIFCLLYLDLFIHLLINNNNFELKYRVNDFLLSFFQYSLFSFIFSLCTYSFFTHIEEQHFVKLVVAFQRSVTYLLLRFCIICEFCKGGDRDKMQK